MIIQGAFSPIILIGMSRYSLLEQFNIDNKQIEDDVLQERNTKMNFNTRSSSVEDSFLPKTPAVTHLLEQIDNILKAINKHLIGGGEAWTHLVEPGQSTMFHTHKDPGPSGL